MSEIVQLQPQARVRIMPPAPAFAELVSTTNFSFLHGGSHPEEMVSAAMYLGLNALGVTDRNSFAGVVRGYVTARDRDAAQFPDFRYLVGVRLCFADGAPDIIAYPTSRVAYGRLCKLLTVGNQRGEKGKPVLNFTDLFGSGEPRAGAAGKLCAGPAFHPYSRRERLGRYRTNARNPGRQSAGERLGRRCPAF